MRIVLIVFAIILSALSLPGQTTQVAQIAGTVQDATGAAIPDTDITITNTDTGIARTATCPRRCPRSSTMRSAPSR